MYRRHTCHLPLRLLLLLLPLMLAQPELSEIRTVAGLLISSGRNSRSRRARQQQQRTAALRLSWLLQLPCPPCRSGLLLPARPEVAALLRGLLYLLLLLPLLLVVVLMEMHQGV